MRSGFFVACALAAVLTATCGARAAAKVGEKAPGFSLTDQDGKTVKLSDYAGKVIVLEWFNDRCPVSGRHHSPASETMTTLAAKYGKSGVVWLAINSTHGRTSVAVNKAAADRMHIGYPVLTDAAGEAGRAYGARTTPDMFVIDASGKLVYSGAIDDDPRGNKGAAAKNYVAAALDAVLAGKPVETPVTRSYGCAVKYGR